ncbi:MAG TPA: class I SAM-dependent methyltransferase [Myxococcaceae bacterium]|nr:class I SAM-dependent methyltransferase [Myxococcaceae bacterium]
MTELAITPSAAAYSPRSLKMYDWFVLGVSNRLMWRCPTPKLLELYQRHVTGRHMDVGVGTGYYLDKVRFPTPEPVIALVDLSPFSLEYAARRIARYRPTTHRADVLAPFQVNGGGFESVGLTYLLHCLPGDLASKAVVFDHVRPHLAPGAVVFGATILGAGVRHNLGGRALMRAYNARGIMGNVRDAVEALESALAERFARHEVEVHGTVAMFTATEPRST